MLTTDSCYFILSKRILFFRFIYEIESFLVFGGSFSGGNSVFSMLEFSILSNLSANFYADEIGTKSFFDSVLSPLAIYYQLLLPLLLRLLLFSKLRLESLRSMTGTLGRESMELVR